MGGDVIRMGRVVMCVRPFLCAFVWWNGHVVMILYVTHFPNIFATHSTAMDARRTEKKILAGVRDCGLGLMSCNCRWLACPTAVSAAARMRLHSAGLRCVHSAAVYPHLAVSEHTMLHMLLGHACVVEGRRCTECTEDGLVVRPRLDALQI